MKSWILFAFTLASLFVISCSEDEETKLDGKWQLQEIVENGEVQRTDTVYYNFQNSLFMYQTYSPSKERYRHSYGFKAQQGSELSLELHSSPQPTNVFLPFTDWTSTKRTFTIEKHNGKQLVLVGDGKTYTFRKF